MSSISEQNMLDGLRRGTSFDPAEMAQRRVAAGYTQRDVAKALGVSFQAVGAWESGRNIPMQVHYDAMVKMYGRPRERDSVDKLPTNPRMRREHFPVPVDVPFLREVLMYMQAVKQKLPDEHISRHEKSLTAEIQRLVVRLSPAERQALEAWL